MSFCQIRRNNYLEYEILLKNAKKVEILFAEDVLLQENFSECCKEVEEIEIYGSKISSLHDSSLQKLLVSQKTITSLSLNCIITSSSFLSVIHQTNLQELYLTHFILNENLIHFLTKGIKHSKLKTLDLSYNDFNDSSFKLLCNSLTSTYITSLFLCCCHVTTERFSHLTNILDKSKITHLDLFLNKIKNEGVSNLCNILPLTKLKYIDLGKNDLTDNACFEIANILPKTLLQNLWLNDNDITTKGIESIFHTCPCTYLTNFQYPLRIMNRFHFIPIFYKNRKKILQYNGTIHFRNFLSLIHLRNENVPDFFYNKDLTGYIMTFL